MKNDTFIKIQKKYGGMWAATNKELTKVYAAGKTIDDLFNKLKKKKIEPTKTVLAAIPRYGKNYIYRSL